MIKSCCKLAYEHAQGFIEKPDKEWTVEELPPISEKFSVQQIKERTLNLHKVCLLQSPNKNWIHVNLLIFFHTKNIRF